MVVYKAINSDGSGRYTATILYKNTSRDIILGDVEPPFIGKFITAGFLTDGSLYFVSVYTEGVQTPEYNFVDWESSSFDISMAMKITPLIIPETIQILALVVVGQVL